MNEKKKSPVVVAIIVISIVVVFGLCFIGLLAAIAVPNFLQAQVQARVARTKADMRTMAVATEAYNIDNDQYPGAFETVIPTRELSILSSPISYVTNSNAMDPFSDTGDSLKYYRFDNRNTDLPDYIFYSVGPDTIDDFPLDSAGRMLPITSRADLVKLEYDPSNGTVSHGNIIQYSN